MPRAPVHLTRGLSSRPRQVPHSPHLPTFSTTGQEATPKCRAELIWFWPPRVLEKVGKGSPWGELTLNSRSWCTSALGPACTETGMEVTRRGTEKILPSRWKLMVTWLRTVATGRKRRSEMHLGDKMPGTR